MRVSTLFYAFTLVTAAMAYHRGPPPRPIQPPYMDPKKPEDWIIKNNWIVQLKDDSKMNPWEHAGWATRMHKEDPQGFYGVVDVYSGTILKGYDGWFSDKTAEKIRKHPDVEMISQNGWGRRDRVLKTNDRFVQRDAPWGLSAISGSKPGEYRYDSSAGSESFVYVIDSGIYLDHSEFQNRAILGIRLTEEPAEDSTQNSDKSHGTFVAGIIGGKTYGVAKNVTLIDVDDGGEDIDDSGHAWMTTVKAIEWTVADIQEKKSAGMAVINISTGFSSGCEHINMAVQGAIDAGVTVVVSAGNTDEEAANVCPANHKAAITVGAIDHNYERSYFSNHGGDVDIFAPGSNITGPYVDGPDSFGVEDGTSIAAPYVSGVIAYLMTLEAPRTPEDMWKRLEHLSVKGKVKDTKKAQNRLLYNGVGGHFAD